MKLNEKNIALRLRNLGESYGEICKKVNVSKGTLSLWLRNIQLTPSQKSKLVGRQKSRYMGAKANQTKRIERSKEIILNAKNEIKSYIKNPLFLSGLMLYWAEGDKSEETEAVKFTNSDPVMIRLMMEWFRKICGVSENKFRICLHIHSLHCREDVQDYWSKNTGISLNQFYKTQVKPTSLRQRRRVLYNGTCAIVVNNRNLFIHNLCLLL